VLVRPSAHYRSYHVLLTCLDYFTGLGLFFDT
jgi:hypothetical protein